MKTTFTFLGLIIIILMGLFSFFKKDDSKYISEEKYNQRFSSQNQSNTIVLNELRKHGATDNSLAKLEFFFYTNTKDKADKLATILRNKDYKIDSVVKSAGNEKEWLINGWSTKMKMDIQTLTDWSTQMCKLGYENDCEFDGWGTNTDFGNDITN